MNKKILHLLTAAAVFALLLIPIHTSVYAEAKSGSLGENISYVLDDEGTLTITGTGDMPDYAKPGYLQGTPFTNNKDIKTVIIDEGITKTGNGIFRNCPELETVRLPESLKTLGVYTFYECSGLKNINIPSGLQSVEYGAFYECTSLTSFQFPDTITSIGESVFGRCTSLTSVHLPANATSISPGLFSECSSLTTVNLPQGLKTVGGDAFAGCRSFCPDTLPNGLQTIGPGAFSSCAFKNISIPDSVTEIGEWAFGGNVKAKTLKLPKNLKVIPAHAFDYCGRIRSITVPATVETIGESAFSSCTDLKEIKIPTNVKTIGSNVFFECFGLEKVTFEGNCPGSMDYAFYGCNLTAYYPLRDKTWTSEVLDSGYGGRIKWVGVCAHEAGTTTVENKKDATALAAGSYDSVVYCRHCSKEMSRKTVSTPKLKATIKLSATKKKLKKGKTYTLKVTGLAKGDGVKKFKSSRKAVATVSSKGKIKAKKKGTAYITVTLKSGKTAKCKITVK